MIDMITFPELPSDEDIRKIQAETAGDIFPITVCECGLNNYFHRLGCKCGGKVRHLWQDKSGSVLECGVDFSPMKQE